MGVYQKITIDKGALETAIRVWHNIQMFATGPLSMLY